MQGDAPRSIRVRRSPLPIVRAVVSSAVLLLLIGGSIPVSGLLEPFAAAVVRAQLVPALLRLCGLVTVGTGMALFVFPLIAAVTGVVGRVYCSSVCPLGTLQDGVFALSRRLFTVKLRFRSPRRTLRAAVLAIVVASWIAGSAVPLSLLEPFSIVSRVLSLARGEPATAPVLPRPEGGPSAAAPPRSVLPLGAAALSAVLLVSVLSAAAARGRLFCNTLCPAGALLGLPARYSILRIRMSREHCTGCGLCERVCPARCIDVRSARVYSGSCTLCFACLNTCRSGALRYGAREAAP